MPEQRELVSLAADLLGVLKHGRRRLAVAESCTGGLVGHLLTEVPGSSDVFVGGAITYDDHLKQQIGVEEKLLEEDGAVSSAVAEAMAAGIRKQSGASLAIGVARLTRPHRGNEAETGGLPDVAGAGEEGGGGGGNNLRTEPSTDKP